MTPKLKSLIFLFAFILCSLLYYTLEEQDKKDSLSNSENFATMQLSDMEDADALEQAEE
ncbi:hypothetical protein I2486_04015 [Cellulophaga sp. E16_2]|uniref:Uncharacterized protein n=1 Tax=Cellulophaga algicola (strain DSM 14237 / IC166 / ACAM 630) TaxID=688270 RepID=E6XES1_CELAD|nr:MULTISPECIES: hypothetical protein [Cellulophaga]ADV48123.1 hypothetical protein Celal_0789 [Cellulophaga algicola DSM 14237]MBO0590565.1 hypothetical protein [Cellulophaga sp. E16_2]